MYSGIWADHVDGAAYPSQDPVFATNGVTEAFDDLYRTHMAGAGCNTLAVEVSFPCEAETVANQLANLCAWASGFEGTQPYVLISLGGPRDAGSIGEIVSGATSLVASLAAKLKPPAGEEPALYQRIVAYRLGPSVNMIAAAKGGQMEAACALAGAVRATVHAAEQATFAGALTPTPVELNFSMDHALLARGKLPHGEATAEDIAAVYADLRTYFDRLTAAQSADILGLEWFAGSISGGTSDDVAALLQSICTDYPQNSVLLSKTGASTAFDTEQAQADYYMGLLAGLAPQAGALPTLLGLCWAYDLDAPAPEAPDADITQRIAAWDPADAGAKIAAALRGAPDDGDAQWWLERTEAALGLAEVGQDGVLTTKIAAAGLGNLVASGVTVAEDEEAAIASVEAEAAAVAAEGPVDLYIASVSVAQGVLQPGADVVLRAAIANPSADDAVGVRVDFSYAAEGAADFAYLADDSIVVDVPAGGQVDVDSPAWPVPAGITHIGVVAWRDGIMEPNEDNNALVADAADLAAAGVVAAAEPAVGPGGQDTWPDDAGGLGGVPSHLGQLLKQKKSEMAEQLIGMVGDYFLGKLGGLLGVSVPTGGGGGGGWVDPGAGGVVDPGVGAGGGLDLVVTALRLTDGSLEAGGSAVVTADIANASLDTNAPNVSVDFSYLAAGAAEWQYMTPETLTTSVNAGQQTSVSTPPFAGPADISDVGVIVYPADGVDANEADNSLTASAAELAGGGVVGGGFDPGGGAVDPGGGAVDPGGGAVDPGGGGVDPGGGAVDPGGGAVDPGGGGGPVDVSVASLDVAEGNLTAGQEAVLRATIANASDTTPANNVSVDFYYATTADAEFQYVTAEPVPINVPAAGDASASTPRWTVPADLDQVAVLTWIDGATDPNEENNTLIAQASDLGGGGGGGGVTPGGGGIKARPLQLFPGTLLLQKPLTAKTGSPVEYRLELPTGEGQPLRGTAYLKVDGEVVDQALLGAPPGGDTVETRMMWMPTGPGEHTVEVVLPGAQTRSTSMQVQVQPGTRLERLPGVLRTAEVASAIEATEGGAAPSGADAGVRRLPGGAGLTSALRTAAASAATGGEGAGAPTKRTPSILTIAPTRTAVAARLPGAATRPAPTTIARVSPTILRTPPEGAADTTPGTRSPTTPLRLPGTTTTRLPMAVARGPMSLTLPTGRVSSGSLATIAYSVKRGGDPITAVEFSLKFDAKLIKLSRVSLTGTTLKRLGWSVRSVGNGPGLIAVTLSGRRALGGTGKLLSFAIASATGKAVSTSLQCLDTKINGDPTALTVSGGAIQVSGKAGTPGTILRPPLTTIPGRTTDTTTGPPAGTTTRPGTILRRPIPGTTTTTTPGDTSTTPPELKVLRTPGLVLGGPLSLTLPSGRVASGKATSISYSVKAGAAPIKSIKFQLKYDPKALKTPTVNLTGTTPGSLRWKLAVNSRTAGVLSVTLSGTRALTGKGKLLSLTLTSATGRTIKTKLQCTSTQVNGKTSAVAVSGGSVEVTASALKLLPTTGRILLPR
jgi:hypothetical protein